ncbi:HNH endonuclease [Streptomyces roseofulvus]
MSDPGRPGHRLIQARKPQVGAGPAQREVGTMRDTLVLNASFEPLSTVTLNRAVVLVLQDKAVVEQSHPDLRVRAAAVDLPVPRVIRLCRFVRVPFRRQAPWSRRGVLVRDQHRCAYCGRRATTVDHVVPRAQGGGDSWLNTVASCAEDNHRKADRTPEQAGMPLLFEPFVPTPADAMLLAMRAGERSELPEWLARTAA